MTGDKTDPLRYLHYHVTGIVISVDWYDSFRERKTGRPRFCLEVCMTPSSPARWISFWMLQRSFPLIKLSISQGREINDCRITKKNRHSVSRKKLLTWFFIFFNFAFTKWCIPKGSYVGQKIRFLNDLMNLTDVNKIP